MDSRMIEAHLAMAERHVAEGRELIEKQREMVARLERDGHDTTTARRLLATLEAIEQMHVADLDRVRRELAQAGPG